MVSDVLAELKDVTARLATFAGTSQEQARSQMDSLVGVFNPKPLFLLRTGELVTQDELDKRVEAQQASVSAQSVRGLHPQLVILDEAQALDPIW